MTTVLSLVFQLLVSLITPPPPVGAVCFRELFYGFQKPQKNYVENKYVVPTDKKRKDLRWRIRADMAAGIMPSGL